MKPLSATLLGVLLLGAACVRVSRSERRVVTLPQGDPRTSLKTCQSLLEAVGRDSLASLGELTPDERQGISAQCMEGTFSEGGHEVSVMISVAGAGDRAGVLADALQKQVQASVDGFFATEKSSNGGPESPAEAAGETTKK